MFSKILKVEEGVSDKYRLTLETETKCWFRLQKGTVQVEGSSTVWYGYPEGARVGTSGEFRICELVRGFEMAQGKKLNQMLGELK